MAHILITQPLHRSFELEQAILSHGDDPICCPLLTIEPAPLTPSLIDQGRRNGQKLDDLIFISPTAVHIAQKWLEAFKKWIQPHPRLIAAGKGTARTIKNSLWKELLDSENDLLYPVKDSGVSALLDLPALSDIQNRQIGIIKGCGGSDLLETELKKRGAVISTYGLYRRYPTPVQNLPLKSIQTAACHHHIGAIIITSSEALRYFTVLLETCFDPIIIKKLKKTLLILTHRRIEELARQCGFSTTVTTEGHSQAIIETLYNRR